MRPSARYPTLELRITDVCTRLADAIAVAALYQCLLRMLYRLRKANLRWRLYAAGLVQDNRWLAQRDGTAAALVDFGKLERVPFAALFEELMALVGEDAAALGCTAELGRVREIVARGTIAQRQRAVLGAALAVGMDRASGLRAVVDHLIAETVMGLAAPA